MKKLHAQRLALITLRNLIKYTTSRYWIGRWKTAAEMKLNCSFRLQFSIFAFTKVKKRMWLWSDRTPRINCIIINDKANYIRNSNFSEPVRLFTHLIPKEPCTFSMQKWLFYHFFRPFSKFCLFGILDFLLIRWRFANVINHVLIFNTL